MRGQLQLHDKFPLYHYIKRFFNLKHYCGVGVESLPLEAEGLVSISASDFSSLGPTFLIISSHVPAVQIAFPCYNRKLLPAFLKMVLT